MRWGGEQPRGPAGRRNKNKKGYQAGGPDKPGVQAMVSPQGGPGRQAGHRKRTGRHWKAGNPRVLGMPGPREHTVFRKESHMT